MSNTRVFRPHVYERVQRASREQLVEIAEAALDVAYPPMFAPVLGDPRPMDEALRARLQHILEDLR